MAEWAKFAMLKGAVVAVVTDMSYEGELTRTYEQVSPPKVMHCALKKEEGKFVGDVILEQPLFSDGISPFEEFFFWVFCHCLFVVAGSDGNSWGMDVGNRECFFDERSFVQRAAHP